MGKALERPLKEIDRLIKKKIVPIGQGT